MVYEILFVVFSVFYCFLSIKLDYWMTIALLGFKSEAPQLYISKPKFYELLRSMLFILSIGLLFMIQAIAWYWGALFLITLWLVAGSLGRKKAFIAYRKILQEMAAYSESEQEKAEYLKRAAISNEQLMDEILKT